MIYCRHKVYIVGTANNAWAQKMIIDNSLKNRCLHMITRIGEKKIFNITPIVASYTHHNTGIQ